MDVVGMNVHVQIKQTIQIRHRRPQTILIRDPQFHFAEMLQHVYGRTEQRTAAQVVPLTNTQSTSIVQDMMQDQSQTTTRNKS